MKPIRWRVFLASQVLTVSIAGCATTATESPDPMEAALDDSAMMSDGELMVGESTVTEAGTVLQQPAADAFPDPVAPNSEAAAEAQAADKGEGAEFSTLLGQLNSETTENSANAAPDEVQTNDTTREIVAKDAADASLPASALEGAAGNKFYVVQRGDTLGEISQMIYGTVKQMHKLITANRLPSPDKIEVGQLLAYEDSEETQAFSASYREKLERLTVKSGDSLYTIAETVYKTPASWPILWQLNQESISNPDQIRVGQVIKYRALEKVSLSSAVTR